MGNKTIEPTNASRAASNNFTRWLRMKLATTNTTHAQLARAIGLERKAIVAYVNNKCSPKLDVVAAIYEYFGEETINLSIKEKT